MRSPPSLSRAARSRGGGGGSCIPLSAYYYTCHIHSIVYNVISYNTIQYNTTYRVPRVCLEQLAAEEVEEAGPLDGAHVVVG